MNNGLKEQIFRMKVIKYSEVNRGHLYLRASYSVVINFTEDSLDGLLSIFWPL